MRVVVAPALRSGIGYVPGRRSRSAAESSILLAGGALLALAAGCADVAPRPLPPRVTLDGVRVARITGTEARFVLKLVVGNPNAYDLSVAALDASLAVEGTALLTAALAAPVTLAAQGDTPIEIHARAGLAAAATVLERVARLPVVRYEVTGSAVVQNGWRLPFARSGELPIGDFLGSRR